jgi:iron(III) transport system substrate-binding protein
MRSLAVATLALGLALPTVDAAIAVEGKLVLYTSQPNTDAQQTIDAFKAKYPKVEVSFVRDGTPRVMAKLRAEFEAGAPQPDVLLIADAVTMEGLKKEGRLLAHDKADLSAFPAGVHDPAKMWFATKLITTGIVYNTKATLKPESWLDLAKPEIKNQLTMPSPLNSGAAMIHTITLAENLPNGWSFYEELSKSGALAAGGNGDVLRRVATGEKLYGMIVDFMPIREKAKGAPVEFVFPAEGVSAVTEPVGILASSKNAEAAKKFVDYVLSVEGQEGFVKLGYIPARNGIAMPEGFPARETIRVLPLDAATALKNTDADLKTFSDHFGSN